MVSVPGPLRIRSAASGEAEPISDVAKGDIVRGVGAEGQWIRIEHKGCGEEAWIMRSNRGKTMLDDVTGDEGSVETWKSQQRRPHEEASKGEAEQPRTIEDPSSLAASPEPLSKSPQSAAGDDDAPNHPPPPPPHENQQQEGTPSGGLLADSVPPPQTLEASIEPLSSPVSPTESGSIHRSQ